MALALRSDFEQESRTAALKAVRLINQHGMLDQAPTPAARTRAIQSDYDARAEIEALREQIAELRSERRPTPTPKPKALPPMGYTSAAILDLTTYMREIEQLRQEVARLQSTPRMLPASPAPAFHIVRPGDTPTSITQMYTGDGARFQELVAANRQKSSYLTPSGARVFVSLVVGERLHLPAGWGR
jgi:nucleoid-associated protein YgaU